MEEAEMPDGSPCGANTGEEPGTSGDGETDLESAMVMMKAALAKKHKSSPSVVNMLDKLMETMKGGDDTEVCLVVSNRRSGKSSVIGPDLTRRGSRKRPAKFYSEEGDDDDSDGSGAAAHVDDDEDTDFVVTPKALSKPRREVEANEMRDWRGKVVTITPPTKERTLKLNLVTEEENRIHEDFFGSRPKSTKTAERYLKIRNHIILLWQQNKPEMVTKAMARKGLLDCGDVNCISRIHTYLEKSGVINFNAEEASTPRSVVKSKRRKIVADTDSDGDPEEDADDTPDYRPNKDGDISEQDRKTKSRRKKMVRESIKQSVVRQSARQVTKPSQVAKTSKAQTKAKNKPANKVKEFENLGPDIEEVGKPTDMTPVRSSGRTRRQTKTPNWAEILSGRKSFRRDGATLGNIKKEVDSDIEEPAEEIEDEAEDSDESFNAEVSDTNVNTDIEELSNDTGDSLDEETPKHEVIFKPMKKQTSVSETNADKGDDSPMKIDGTATDAAEGDSVIENEQPIKIIKEQSSDCNIVTIPPHINSRPAILFQCRPCLKTFLEEAHLTKHINEMHKANQKETPMQIEKTKGSEEEEDGDLDDDFSEERVDENNGVEMKDKNEGTFTKDPNVVSEVNPNVKIETYKIVKFKPQSFRVKTPVQDRVAFVKKGKKEKHECEKCGTEFLSVVNLKRHMLLHSNKVYECPHCAKIMKRMDYVNAHIKKVHPDVDLTKNPVDFEKYSHTVDENEDEKETNANAEGRKDKIRVISGTGKKVCPDCSNLFDTQAELEEHMIVVHQKELKDSAYTCRACQKQFKTLVSFQVHKLSHRKKDFVCAHCDQKFTSNTQLQVHKRNDHEIRHGTLAYFGYLKNNDRITCEICSSDFDSFEEYLPHRHDHLTFEYLCSKCGNGFMTQEMFDGHLKSYCKKEQHLFFPCGVCNKRFGAYEVRRKHLISAHPKEGTQHYCHHCAKTFSSDEDLQQHIVEHVAEKVFFCEFCEKLFFEKRILVDHRDTHKASKNFQCKICLKFYYSSRSLQRHIKLHLYQTQKACKICEQKFSTQDDLIRHMTQDHGEVESYEDRELLPCPHCTAQFKTENKLEKHILMHSLENSSSKYMCSHCDKVLDSNEVPLDKHMEMEHPLLMTPESTNVGYLKKDFRCPHCDFFATVKQRLDRHMEVHNVEKKFECKYCLKKFQTTSSLMTHVIMHRGKVRKNAKPEPICTWPGCHKQFMKHSIYKRHIVAHIYKIKNGKEVCFCKQCEYSGIEGKKINVVLRDGEIDNVQALGFLDQQSRCQIVAQVGKGLMVEGEDGLRQAVTDTEEENPAMEVLQEAIAQIEDIERHNGQQEPREEVVGNVIEQEHEDGVGSTTTTEMSGYAQSDEKTVEAEHNQGAEEQVTAGTQTMPQDDDDEPADMIVNAEDDGEIKVRMIAVNDGAANTANTKSILIQPLAGAAQQGDGAMYERVTTYMEDDVDAVLEGVNAEGNYECGVCELMFEHACQVLRHFEGAHPLFRFPKCEVCSRYALDQKGMADHKLTHEDVKKYKCPECDRYFRTKAYLKQHVIIHQTNKPYVCGECGHGFSQKGIYQEHLRRHLGVKPFKCAICNKQFVSKSLLKIHMYSHTSERPYKCPYCPKGFAERYVMQVHMRQHENDRPFQCTECSKNFCARPKLVRHMSTVHGIDKEELTSFVPTKVGEGVGYRDSRKLQPIKPALPQDERRKTKVVYIDQHGIVVKEVQDGHEKMYADTEAVEEESKTTEADLSNIQLEVVTHRDADGNIQTILPVGNYQNLISGNEEGLPVVYQEVESEVTGEEEIEMGGQSYTLVATDGEWLTSDVMQKQLIAQGITSIQENGDTEEGGKIQVITQEVGELEGAGEGGMVVSHPGDGQEGGVEGEVQKFSINISEDGTVNAEDLEALRHMYNDQQIVIVLENQQQE
ncbi:uncharacterized protein LOC128233082 isoform X2 [Mya arenaria]|uniref:uncharacterized protein LOC128233082 isoform X2 n=1 Tax=Mya arenaria TaxID=6604 RepID=UPI0022E21C9E|nr:uncharacterized protein LOC128233082 isoform X2 [Mya arenaria]